MGMFDSFYDDAGNEWQTKAYIRNLDVFRVGDPVPNEFPETYPKTYQVEILGGEDSRPCVDSFATVISGVLVSINDERDTTLPLINYSGHWVEVAR